MLSSQANFSRFFLNEFLYSQFFLAKPPPAILPKKTFDEIPSKMTTHNDSAGHSLGGAIAVLAAFDILSDPRITRSGINLSLVTFGQPRVVAAKSVAFFAAKLDGGYVRFKTYQEMSCPVYSVLVWILPIYIPGQRGEAGVWGCCDWNSDYGLQTFWKTD